MAPPVNPLASGRLNLSQIRESYLRELVALLDGMVGNKCIVWDEQYMKSFLLIVELKVLQAHGVNHMLRITKGMQVITEAQNFVFLIPPKFAYMDIVADCVKQRKNIDFHIIFVPRASFICQQRLEQLGVLGSLQIHQFLVELFPLDSDVMSMELPDIFKECMVEGNTSQLLAVARALSMLQSLYGVAPNIRGKGPMAQRLSELMLRLRKELSGKQMPQVSQIDTIMLFDRCVDLLTPMATQLTYEGLLDEMFGVKNNRLTLPGDKFQDKIYSNLKKNGQITFPINSGEDLYADLRDRNFTTIGANLNKLAKNLAKQELEIKEASSKHSIPFLRECAPRVQKINETKSGLSKHISISELVQENINLPLFGHILGCEQELLRGEFSYDKTHPKIEDLIARGEPMNKVIRLICMHSITANGLKPKILESYKTEIIHQYGIEKLVLLQNLEKCGLIKQYPSSSKGFNVLSKTLRLTSDNINQMEPKDFAHVYQIYAPISVRIMEEYGKSDWRGIKEMLQYLPGAEVREIQPTSYNKLQRRNSRESLQSTIGYEDKKLVLVVFIGGCTFAEISALRWLSRQEDFPLEFVILTTNTINGSDFIETLST